MKKRILSLALASAMAVGTVSGAFAETEATEVYSGPQYIKGNESGNFMPNSKITRQEIAVMVGRALELEGSKPDFKDADKIAAWADEFVAGLQDAEIVKGDDKGNFNPTNKITRAELAAMVVRAYENATGEELSEGDTSFSDVADDAWYAKEVKKAAEAGLVLGNGSGAFNPMGEATRAETVMMINRMLGLGEDNLPSDIAEALETELKDSDEWPSWAIDAILVASSAYEYTVGEDGKIVIKGEEEDLAVESVSAITQKSLEIKGAGLDKLKAEDITVEGNTVKSITVSEDKKTATVALDSELVVDEATKVTVGEEEFEVTYTVEATEVSVNEATYDDDIKDQFVAIKVDGKSVSAQELMNAGYTVEFNAYTTKAATTSLNTELFGAATSSTGELVTTLGDPTAPFLTTLGLASLPASGADIYVKVTISKGAEVINSELAKVTIKNLDLAADSITAATLLNYGTDGTVDGAWADDFEQNSTTLVTGEKASFSEIKVKAGSEEETVTTGYNVKSSDPAVISVTGGVLTAEGPGTATVTVTYGTATYTKTITVKNEKREAAKVTAEKSTVSLTSVGTASTKIYLFDQYGDPMAITGANLAIVNSDNSVATAAISQTTADIEGDGELTFTGVKAGSTSVTFRDASGVKIGTTAVKANVTSNDTLSQYSISVDNDITTTAVTGDVALVGAATGAAVTKDDISTDATLDLLTDKYVKLNLKGLNSAGVEVSNQLVDGTVPDYNVTTNVSADGVLAATPTFSEDGFLVVEAGTKAGTATITVTNATDSKIVKTFSIKVEKVGYNVNGATLKNVSAPTYNQTLNYEDFLTYKSADNDPLISGLTLSKDASQPIRLALTAQAGAVGDLYIDKNADGIYDATDVKVGSVVMTTSGTIAAAPVADAIAGIAVATGDDGTVLFKVVDNNGNVVATKAVTVNF